MERMKTALQQLAYSKPATPSSIALNTKLNPIVSSSEYEEANTVSKFFKLLAPHWNWVEYGLLEFVVQASRCKFAMEKLQEFLESRKHAAPNIVLQPSNAVEATSMNSPQLSQPVTAPTLSAEVTTDCRHEVDQVAVMKVDKDTFTLADYDRNASLLSRVMDVPRYLLSFLCISPGCIAIHWKVLGYLSFSAQRILLTDSSFQALAKEKIVQITIGSHFHLNIATMAYWEPKQEVEVRHIIVHVSHCVRSC